MMRSPLFYAMGRGMDVDAGGAAELQTDVMRFMAILSLCLVAIFALVQSLPVAEKPTPPDSGTVTLTDVPESSGTVTVTANAEPAGAADSITDPEPVVKVTVPEATEPVVMVTVPDPPDTVTSPEPVVKVTVPKTPITVTVPKTQKVGFTLQFESDDALTRLVSSREVGLYVIGADQSMRLSIDGKRLNFWPASLPAQYHEMDSSTVPVDVRRALLRSGTDTSVDAIWGVTLPPRTARQLQAFLADSSGGSLIIGENGELRLEP